MGHYSGFRQRDMAHRYAGLNLQMDEESLELCQCTGEPACVLCAGEGVLPESFSEVPVAIKSPPLGVLASEASGPDLNHPRPEATFLPILSR